MAVKICKSEREKKEGAYSFGDDLGMVVPLIPQLTKVLTKGVDMRLSGQSCVVATHSYTSDLSTSQVLSLHTQTEYIINNRWI